MFEKGWCNAYKIILEAINLEIRADALAFITSYILKSRYKGDFIIEKQIARRL